MTQTRKKQRILVFTTPTCTYCNMVKKYLRQKKVRFKEIDVSRDQTAARDMVKRSGQMGVPVIDINGKIILGFDRAKLDKYLELD